MFLLIVPHPCGLFVASNSDHLGVPNVTLVKEGSHLAKIYNNKSVAEQNSGKRHKSQVTKGCADVPAALCSIESSSVSKV